MRYINAFFDLDGTLTESGPGILHSFRYALDRLGIDPGSRDLTAVIGPPLAYSFRLFNVAEDMIPEAVRLYRELYLTVGKYENLPYEGIRETLTSLREAGIRLYVATSKPESLACDILAHFELDSFFDIIAGASTDGSRSHKKDVLEYLLKQIPDAQKSVMIGDTVFDIEGANAANLPSIGVSWGYGNIEDMEKAGAETIVRTPAQLYAYLSE